MSAFFDRFEELCRARGETPNSVAKKLGIPSGSITAWKKGTEPRSKTIWKLVDFFGVDFNYMLGRTNEPTSFRLENGKFIITRPKNSPDLSEEAMLAREKHEIEEIQKALNTYTKKAPTPEDERMNNDPDLYRIERARKSMSEADKKKMMNILKASFEDYFSDNYADDDLDE